MKTRLVFFILLSSILLTPSFAQEKSRRELRKEMELERKKQVEDMIQSRDFVFIPRTAMPQSGPNIDLTINPGIVKFQPELIESDMPYFGREYSGAGYGGDTGMRFSGKPDGYTFDEKRKNYLISAQVRSGNDTYKLSFSVS